MFLKSADLHFTRSLILWFDSSEHTQDKHIQRDDEYYEGDNDNDHNMEDT